MSLCSTGVARAVRILSAVVPVRPPAEFMRQRSSQEALSAMDTNGVSSASPGAGSLKGLDGHRHNSTQVVTAHDNGQLQVWDMSTGFLQPVLRMGVVGPSARSALPAQNTIFANMFISAQISRDVVARPRNQTVVVCQSPACLLIVIKLGSSRPGMAYRVIAALECFFLTLSWPAGQYQLPQKPDVIDLWSVRYGCSCCMTQADNPASNAVTVLMTGLLTRQASALSAVAHKACRDAALAHADRQAHILKGCHFYHVMSCMDCYGEYPVYSAHSTN